VDIKRDIEEQDDIEKILQAFYGKAIKDTHIGHFFTEVVLLDLEQHLPHITAFWTSVLWQTHSYQKNVMQVHQHIHQLSHIKKAHLERWVALFTQTIDALYEGPRATLMKQRAVSIATLMDIKLNHPTINKIS